MEKNRIRFIPYDEIGKVAKDILEKYGLSKNIPIDIERLLDNKLRINIIPYPGLFKSQGINSQTSRDFKTIYVDGYMFDRLEPQYRFTLAHEYGHVVLHEYFYNKEFESIKKYKDFMNSISNDEYNRLEIQANLFAGQFLVPTDHLKRIFKPKLKIKLDSVKDEIEKYDREDYIDYLIEAIAIKMAPAFNVHHKVIEIRIDRENLVDKIP